VPEAQPRSWRSDERGSGLAPGRCPAGSQSSPTQERLDGLKASSALCRCRCQRAWVRTPCRAQRWKLVRRICPDSSAIRQRVQRDAFRPPAPAPSICSPQWAAIAPGRCQVLPLDEEPAGSDRIRGDPAVEQEIGRCCEVVVAPPRLDPAASQQEELRLSWLAQEEDGPGSTTHLCQAADGNGWATEDLQVTGTPPEANTKTQGGPGLGRSVPVWPNPSAQKICARFFASANMALACFDPSAGSSSISGRPARPAPCWSRCCPQLVTLIQAGVARWRPYLRPALRDCQRADPTPAGRGGSRSCLSNDSDPSGAGKPYPWRTCRMAYPGAPSRTGLVSAQRWMKPIPDSPHLEALCREVHTSRRSPDSGFRGAPGDGSDDLPAASSPCTASGRNYWRAIKP